MIDKLQYPEVPESPEKIIGGMSAMMQAALSECGVEPVLHDDGSSTRSVETSFGNSIQPSAVRLTERTGADGGRSYEYDNISYNYERDTFVSLRWSDGSTELTYVQQPIGSKSELTSPVARKVDVGGFVTDRYDGMRAFEAIVKKVPVHYESLQKFNKFHGITNTASKFEQQAPRRATLGNVMGKLSSALARRS